MIISPLRYPGSKRKLFNYLQRVLAHNKLQPKVLVEPFVGGGSIFLYFLLNNVVDKIVIADKDRLIYSFWKVLFRNPNHLIKFIKKTEINLTNFYKYKKIATHYKSYGIRKLAEACLFLNRTSFSGILTNNAGPLGGRGQKSKYRIDCRFNKKYLIEKIEYLASFRNKVIILPYDWRQTVRDAQNLLQCPKDSSNIFFYFDPPFYHKAEQLYRHYFNTQDHEDLRNIVISLKYPWLLSYDNAPEIKKMYSGFKKIHVQMPYSINSPAKRIEKELIITPLKLPKI